MAAEAPFELGPAAEHLGEVSDLIWPETYAFSGVPYNFCFMKLSQNFIVWAAHTLEPWFRAPWPWGLGYLWWADVVLHSQFKLLCWNGLTAYKDIQTPTNADSHLYNVDSGARSWFNEIPLCQLQRRDFYVLLSVLISNSATEDDLFCLTKSLRW